MQQYPRLKVEDALTYLDRVKQQFCSQPQVYNNFLDIMKEFKSQTIDTPGVIGRVSTLFQGHKELIVGFNTFLPPGYKIELNKATDTINIFQPGQRGGTPTHMSLSSFETMHLAKDSPSFKNSSQDNLFNKSTCKAANVNETSSGKPVEFDHAISYVNKIKSRYQSQPEIYKSFLEILHLYQKDDKLTEESAGNNKKLSETEVLSKVANLFTDQPDLLTEFGQFLPDATLTTSISNDNLLSLCSSTMVKKGGKQTTPHHRRRRMSSIGSTSSVTSKRVRHDVKPNKEFMSEIGKCGSLLDFAFFDKVRKMLGDITYMEFLKCLKLFSIADLHMTSTELMQMIQPFCMKMPELKRRMKELMRKKCEASSGLTNFNSLTATLGTNIGRSTRDRSIVGEFAGEIDYASCKRLDVSYLAIPRGHIPPKCSGRTSLCHEVLNDTYVSFPSWSEDSSSVIKKTMAEEQLFRCEEDRCQLDVVLDNFVGTSELMLFVKAKMDSLPSDEAAKYKLDNCLGGRSEFLHRKTLQRLYGDKANQVIEALKQNPFVLVPIVQARLQSKIEEWRDARRHNSRNWNEINQRYYLKALDHAGLTIKQTDTKVLRSKALLNEIETAFQKRQEHSQTDLAATEVLYSIVYPGVNHAETVALMGDASGLVIHHVKRQMHMHASEKRKMKQFLKRFLPDLLYATRGQLSDDEAEQELETDRKDKEEDKEEDASLLNHQNKTSLFIGTMQVDESSQRSVFYANEHFFIFLRLHCILCQRLAHFKEKAQIIGKQYEHDRAANIPSVALSIRLKSPPSVDYTQLYEHLMKMIANFMDGLVEPAAYEEQLREMFVTDACIGYTIDKLIHAIVRQLQHLVTDESCVQLFELYRTEHEDLAPKMAHLHANTVEIIYQHQAIQALYPDDKCFKFITNRGEAKVDVDMLSGRPDSVTPAITNWVADVSSWPPSHQTLSYKSKPISFLNRNLMRGKQNQASIKYSTMFECKSENCLETKHSVTQDIFVFRKIAMDRNKLVSKCNTTRINRSKRFDRLISLRHNTANSFRCL